MGGVCRGIFFRYVDVVVGGGCGFFNTALSLGSGSHTRISIMSPTDTVGAVEKVEFVVVVDAPPPPANEWLLLLLMLELISSFDDTLYNGCCDDEPVPPPPVAATGTAVVDDDVEAAAVVDVVVVVDPIIFPSDIINKSGCKQSSVPSNVNES